MSSMMAQVGRADLSKSTLVLPLPPNAANLRRHWRVALKDKKAYWRTLNLLEVAGRLPKPPVTPFDPALIAVHLYVWNPLDPDNAMHRLKPILDWLKGVWIADDSAKHLLWAGLASRPSTARTRA